MASVTHLDAPSVIKIKRDAKSGTYIITGFAQMPYGEAAG